MLSLFADLSPAEAVALSTGTYAVLSVPVVLLAPVELDAQSIALDTALSAAALLMLLTITPETP